MFLLEAPRSEAIAALAAGRPVRDVKRGGFLEVRRLGLPGGPSAGYIAIEFRNGKVIRESAPSKDPEVALDMMVHYKSL